MSDVNILRSQVKKMIEDASERELEMVYHLFEATNSNDWWDEIGDDQKNAIDKGIAQLNSGAGIPHEEIVKKYSKWLKK